ncbi:MAG: tryptophan--tRNA ligase [Deltaproteobacteria bacterium]|nr:tryptophan--tRNA ligase [Deltaproteobacteria bacterium]
MSSKKRIVSGMRPTGSIHLGNFHGALTNWIKMQNEYDAFYFVADWHALTSEYEKPENILKNSQDMLIDWLASGLDPEKATIFIQSQIKEHAELYLLLSMITPTPWLERNPTYKEQILALSNKDLSTFGFLGYPVLQAADIIIYKANAVPVGVDQIPHVEITREIARRFNRLYGKVFPEPQATLTQSPKILGIDRRKMSKSYNNAIYLSDAPETIAKKASSMVTDPQRARKTDPGDPSVCNVYEFHKLYTPEVRRNNIEEACKKAEIGCVECKKIMSQNLIEALAPFREKREYYLANPNLLKDIIQTGNQKAQAVASATMEEARASVKL